MKKINRFYTLMLILLVLVSMLVTPVAAASDSWQNRFRQFPLLSSGSSRSGYVKALQTFLYYYSYETKQLISDGGGIDGSYGSKTFSAVKKFQGDVFPDDPSQHDGITGSNTWGAIARVTEVFQPSANEYIFIWYTQEIIRAIPINSGYYYYYNVGPDEWKIFRTT